MLEAEDGYGDIGPASLDTRDLDMVLVLGLELGSNVRPGTRAIAPLPSLAGRSPGPVAPPPRGGAAGGGVNCLGVYWVLGSVGGTEGGKGGAICRQLADSTDYTEGAIGPDFERLRCLPTTPPHFGGVAGW